VPNDPQLSRELGSDSRVGAGAVGLLLAVGAVVEVRVGVGLAVGEFVSVGVAVGVDVLVAVNVVVGVPAGQPHTWNIWSKFSAR